MSNELEIEYKNMLSEDDYHRLFQTFFPDISPVQQTNYYFDTADSKLKKHHMGLRIREKSNQFEYTLKIPTDQQETMIEITDLLTHQDWSLYQIKQQLPSKGKVTDYLETINILPTDLHVIGSLQTSRLEKNIADGVLLVLDKSTFGKVVDYELEMEFIAVQQSHSFFKQFLIDYHLPVLPAKKKIARMVEYQ